MLQRFVENRGWSQQYGGGPRRGAPVGRLVRSLPVLGVTGALALGAGCSSQGDTLVETLDGWARSEAWDHADVIDFDNVATASYRDTLAWATRAEPGETSLTYWQVAEEGPVTRTALPAPQAPVTIPVAVAQDNHRWAVAAVARDTPAGRNTGTYVWAGDGTTGDRAGRPRRLVMPDTAGGQPDVVSMARTTETTVVAGLAAGEPVVWRQEASGSDTSPAARWDGEELDLGLEAATDLVSLRLGGDGERLVLAGVDDEGTARLWASPDGRSWEPVAGDELPVDAGGVAGLAVLGPGELLVAWLGPDGEPGEGATRVSAWRLEGTELSELGTLRPAEGQPRLDVNDATVSPDGDVLVVGEGIDGDQTRVPLAWARQDGEWDVTEQEGLTSRLDHRLRAVAAIPGDELVAVMTHVNVSDVELWRWHRGD